MVGMPVILALRRLRQEDDKIEVSLGFIVRPIKKERKARPWWLTL
jgi:hypothetical protein